jgi:hypothetical protein
MPAMKLSGMKIVVMTVNTPHHGVKPIADT